MQPVTGEPRDVPPLTSRCRQLPPGDSLSPILRVVRQPRVRSKRSGVKLVLKILARVNLGRITLNLLLKGHSRVTQLELRVLDRNIEKVLDIQPSWISGSKFKLE